MKLCPPATAIFPGLDTVYCKNEEVIVLTAIPAGGQFSGTGVTGNELRPALIAGYTASIMYEWTDVVSGCPYDTVFQLNFIDPPEPLMITCTAEYTSVTFTINANANLFAYQIAINDGSFSTPDTSTISSKTISPVMAGDKVEMLYWVLGHPPCENGDTFSVVCYASSCPDIHLEVIDPGLVCEDTDPIPLTYTAQNLSGNETITWSGEGIIDPSGLFQPDSGFGLYKVYVHIDAGDCEYEDAGFVQVRLAPVASFAISGVPCLDSTLLLEFSGYAWYGGSDWHWDFDGADATELPIPDLADFWLHWDEPGTYEVSLWIDYQGCISDTFAVPVKIDAPLTALDIQCVEENYYDIVIGWDPVLGATDYIISHNEGSGKLTGTTYTISNLEDDSRLEIIVTASGPSSCGTVSDTIECVTKDYIPVNIYFPGVFSPNGDGINDIVFIQSNATVSTIHSLRIMDRWGNLVFENIQFAPNDPLEGWNGSFNGKVMNPGVYLYILEYETSYGDVERKVGDVTLLR
jgi:gliding motility-associated-like protein